MRYQLEFHEDPRLLSVHVDIPLVNTPFDFFILSPTELEEFFDDFEEIEKKHKEGTERLPVLSLVVDLFELRGVAELSAERYELFIIRGELFEWGEEFIAKILGA